MGAIYVVATPIGNLEDVTLRAIRVLREADLVAAEDTRRTRKLLDHFGIAKRVVAYHDAVEAARAPELVRRALGGESIALVTDAGTPLVADPGFRLVRAAIAAGVDVVPIPGPSAALALLCCAGLPPSRFTFVGFLPARSSARRRTLAELADRPETLLLYETARRLPASLADMAALLGPRPAAVGRELTKRFEEIERGPLDDLAARFAARAERAGLKGEIVVAVAGSSAVGEGEEVVAFPATGRIAPQGGRAEGAAAGASVGGPSHRPRGSTSPATLVDECLRTRLAAGEPVSTAARAVAKELGLTRRVVYRRALDLRPAPER